MKIFYISISILFLSLKCLAQSIKAPDFNLPALNGEQISLSSFKGNLILLDFWASWCPPCRKELPYINKIHNKYKDKGLKVVGLSVDNNDSKWKAAIKKFKLSYPQLIDQSGATADLYRVNYIPTIFLIDKDGSVIAINPEHKVLEKLIEQKL